MSVEGLPGLGHFRLGDKIVLAIAVITLVAILAYINYSVEWALGFASLEYLAGMVTAGGLIWLGYVAIKWVQGRVGQ